MPQSYRIQSVQRAINIINCFTENTPYLSLQQISEQLELNINTTRGLVQTLVANDVLAHDKGRNIYLLGYYFNAKSQLVNSNLDTLINVVKPFLHTIAQQQKMACSFQLVQGESIYSACFENPGYSYYHLMGTEHMSLPYHATASGKLALAYLILASKPDFLKKMKFQKFTENTITQKSKLLLELSKIKAQGYAVEAEEFEPSINSIALPLFNTAGQLFASLSITGIAADLLEHEAVMVACLQQARQGIEAKLSISTTTKTEEFYHAT